MVTLTHFSPALHFIQKQLSRAALKNFAKFTGKHLCQSFFFNKVVLTKFFQICFLKDINFSIKEVKVKK